MDERLTIVIFGASGDLTSRKLMPALFRLYEKGRLPKDFQIVGVSRRKMTDDRWCTTFIEKLSEGTNPQVKDAFFAHLHYFPADVMEPDSFQALEMFLKNVEESQPAARVYYLATAPEFFPVITSGLAPYAGEEAQTEGATRRIVIEKPFGTDLNSARTLNEQIHQNYAENQIFRIDHYLGKETAQNLMVFRFANAIFEPIWNRNYIQSVQITANEETLVGRRAPYYNRAGVLRDMFQNHLLQLLTLIAMEPPVRFDADSIRDEKVKVLQSVRPLETSAEIQRSTLRGRYDLPAERESLEACTPTFGAVRFLLDNWRWRDVPFYLRSGKGMSCQTSQIVVEFRPVPFQMFPNAGTMQPNRLLIQIQPAEGIQLYFQTKVPDAGMRTCQSELHFNFAKQFAKLPEAYERLLLDAIQGEAGLFARADEVECAWKIIDPIQREWDASCSEIHPYSYKVGAWGPSESDTWMESWGSSWFDLCPILK